MELFKALLFVSEPSDPMGPDKGQWDGAGERAGCSPLFPMAALRLRLTHPPCLLKRPSGTEQ